MKQEFKPFQQIIVKNQVWRAEFFSHKREDGFLITMGGGAYKEENVLPYEGNEYLLGTDNDPKPKRWRGRKMEVYYFIEDNLMITHSFEVFSNRDNDRYEIGNYFKSPYDAKDMADKIKKILEHNNND